MSADEISRKSTILVVGANSTIGIAIVWEFRKFGDVVVAMHCKSNPELVAGD